MKRTAAMLTLGLGLLQAAVAAETPLVGVLELPQCQEGAVLAVRPLFAHGEDGWRSIGSEAAAAGLGLDARSWTIALDGKPLGTLTTAAPSAVRSEGWDGARDLLLPLAEGATAPPTGNTQQRFGGWCDTPTRRPLVASSAGHSADPDGWKPYDPPAALAAELFERFHSAAGAADNCSDASANWAYAASDLQLLRGYRDRNGRRLVGVQLDPAQNACDGMQEDAWREHWFLLADDVSLLGVDLSLVEAIDLDGSGDSELLFWFSGYNQDGYVLFHDGLRQKVERFWSYH